MAIIRETNGDAAAGADTRYTLSLDDVFQGTLDPAGDNDWVKVELSAGTIYLFTIKTDEAVTGDNPLGLELFDSGGNYLVRSEYKAEAPTVNASIVFKATETGSYYINARSVADDYSGSYEISFTENTIPVGTYDEMADYMTDDYWEFWGSPAFAFDVGPGDTLSVNINVLTKDGQALARWALEAWTNVTGIHFQIVTDEADLTFTNEPGRTTGGADVVTPEGVALAANVNVQPGWVEEGGNTLDSYSFLSIVHEIGHALGLGHPGPYPEPFGAWVAYFGVDNVFLIDSQQISLMSYFHHDVNTYLKLDWAFAVTPMIADIIAIQKLYGVPDSINTGDTVYGYKSNVEGYMGDLFALWTGERNPLFHTGVERYSAPAFADLDGDGDPDLVIGNQEGAMLFFENTGAVTAPDFTERVGAGNPFQGVVAGGGSSKPVFVDLDGDGDLDVVVGEVWGDLIYLENAGTQSRPRFIEHSGAANPLNGVNTGAAVSAPAFADLDNDGDPDMVVGDSDGDVHYFENIGTHANPRFIERTGAANPLHGANVGEWVIPSFVDLDNDGDADLVTANWLGIHYYFENTGESDTPAFIERTGVDNPLNGLQGEVDSAPAFADLDDDGDPDLIIGNRYGTLSYFENAGTPAAPDFISTNLTNPIALTLYDNGGIDTLDLRTDRNDQRVDLRPEGISDVYGLTGNLVIARDTVIENVVAGSGNDIVVGNAVANYISGADGNDRIWGSGGDDILEGGAGNDTLNGGPGADRLDGGPGSDTASYQHSAAAVLVRLQDASAVRLGDAWGDVLTGIEHLVGSAYNDILAGDGADNILKGEDGDDVLYGGPAGGDDMMYGGNGDDRLFGGRGDDTLTGGEGNDVLKGGPGADTIIVDGDEMDVVFGGPDNDTFRFFPSDLGGGTIRDFSDGEDIIDLTEFTGISSMDDLDIVSHGDNVRIRLSGTDYSTTIILSDFDVGNLDNSDFLF